MNFTSHRATTTILIKYIVSRAIAAPRSPCAAQPFLFLSCHVTVAPVPVVIAVAVRPLRNHVTGHITSSRRTSFFIAYNATLDRITRPIKYPSLSAIFQGGDSDIAAVVRMYVGTNGRTYSNRSESPIDEEGRRE